MDIHGQPVGQLSLIHIYGKRFFCEEHLLLTVPARFSVNETMKNYALTAADILEERHLNSRIPPVSLEHFQNESFLLLKGGNDTRERADRIFHNAHFLPKVRLEPVSYTHLEALRTGRQVRDLILEKGLMDEEQLNTVLDPYTMTEPGILGKDPMEQLRG